MAIKPLTNIDEHTAQLELDDVLFPHYVLGRNLALEAVVREIWAALPAKKRAEVVGRLAALGDDAIARATKQMDLGFDKVEDAKLHATDCGFAHTLLLQKF